VGATLRVDGGREVDLGKVARGLALLAKSARQDPGSFMEFVMREENQGRRIRLAAHQRVMFAFVNHEPHRFANVIQAVGSTKTTLLTSYGLWRLACDTNLRGAVYSRTQKIAKKPLRVMRQLIEGEPRVRLVNEMMVPGWRSGDEWGDTSFTVNRTNSSIKDPSFQAAGLDTGMAACASTSSSATTCSTPTTATRRT
jgi:hypothetical protein